MNQRKTCTFTLLDPRAVACAASTSSVSFRGHAWKTGAEKKGSFGNSWRGDTQGIVPYIYIIHNIIYRYILHSIWYLWFYWIVFGGVELLTNFLMRVGISTLFHFLVSSTISYPHVVKLSWTIVCLGRRSFLKGLERRLWLGPWVSTFSDLTIGDNSSDPHFRKNWNWQWGYHFIWVNYNISLTWIKAHLGLVSLMNYDSSEVAVRSQWGRYNLPRFYDVPPSELIFEVPMFLHWQDELSHILHQ